MESYNADWFNIAWTILNFLLLIAIIYGVIKKNIKLIYGLVAISLGILQFFKSNGILGYIGGVFILLGGIMISFQSLKRKKLNISDK